MFDKGMAARISVGAFSYEIYAKSLRSMPVPLCRPLPQHLEGVHSLGLRLLGWPSVSRCRTAIMQGINRSCSRLHVPTPWQMIPTIRPIVRQASPLGKVWRYEPGRDTFYRLYLCGQTACHTACTEVQRQHFASADV